MILHRAFELRREHRNEEALAAYEQAFTLSPTPAIRAQRALAEQAVGHWLTAESDLDLALATDDPWVKRNRLSLEDAMATVRQHLAWLTVDVDTPGADILVDGERLPQGTEARVVAGVGFLEVRAPDCIPIRQRVSLGASEHVRQRIALTPVVLALPPSPAPPAPPAPPAVAAPEIAAPVAPPVVVQAAPEIAAPVAPPVVVQAAPEPRARSSVPVLPLVLSVVGAAGIATGAYFGVRAIQDKSDEHTQCIGGCTQGAANDYSDAQVSSAASTIAFGVGVALVTGGGLLWLLNRPAARATAAAFEVAPVLYVGLNGLVLRGRL